ncbi:amino acid ABC transporter permease [Bauldia sp.]|uniref:amino acid ABC transporter permease n=1 Tax=Bauldia sp. TaxID=2575872 RepID=UPI003BAD91BC
MANDHPSNPRRGAVLEAAVEPGLAAELAYVRGEEEPVLPAPRRHVGVIAWLREGFFSSITNTVMTIIGILFLLWAIPPLLDWAIFSAVWTGDSREACIAPGTGACWAFVNAKFGQFMYGRYPIDERWRADIAGIILTIGIVWLAVPRIPYKSASAILLFGIFPIAALFLLTGGNFDVSAWTIPNIVLLGFFATAAIASFAARNSSPLLAGRVAPIVIGAALGILIVSFFVDGPVAAVGQATISFSTIVIWLCGIAGFVLGLLAIHGSRGRPGARALVGAWFAVAVACIVIGFLSIDFGLVYVETELWGGLLVTLVIALTGMGASLPLGIALALGRRSRLPVIRFVSIAFIEFVRGVPLITVLFMASVMLPLFLPPGVNFDKLLRALIGVALFTSAYMAEVVRGGLQAIPKGQYEAAQALGLNYWKSMRLIILPQALKIVIPGIVNSFISLFKDTSLVLIIGIFDLLGIVRANFSDANWASPPIVPTGYVFAGFVFWAFCFGMSRYSLYMERRLDTGYRR